MQIQVTGQQINIGQALQTHVEEKITEHVTKYFEQAIHADVVFSKEGSMIRADIHLNEGTGKGLTVKGNATLQDIYAAFDQALERTDKQLRRYKRRIKNHHKKHDPLHNPSVIAQKFIIEHNAEEEEASDEDNPLIIAKKDAQIDVLTVSDAVMRMNLANLPALLFIEKKSGNVSVVYTREDGNISWVTADELHVQGSVPSSEAA